MKLGDIVTVTMGTKIRRPHVVLREPVNGRVKLCYCGTGRWYVPEWMPLGWVSREVDDGAQLRRAKRLLLAARAKPDPDGWIRILAGPVYKLEPVIVGHVDVPWSWTVTP